jgi:hypothetical protein
LPKLIYWCTIEYKQAKVSKKLEQALIVARKRVRELKTHNQVMAKLPLTSLFHNEVIFASDLHAKFTQNPMTGAFWLCHCPLLRTAKELA